VAAICLAIVTFRSPRSTDESNSTRTTGNVVFLGPTNGIFERKHVGDMHVEDKAETADTPEIFLIALGESLKGKEGVDVGMADILSTHILKAAPTQNAVTQAKDAILKLASERATPPKPEVAND